MSLEEIYEDLIKDPNIREYFSRFPVDDLFKERVEITHESFNAFSEYLIYYIMAAPKRVQLLYYTERLLLTFRSNIKKFDTLSQGIQFLGLVFKEIPAVPFFKFFNLVFQKYLVYPIKPDPKVDTKLIYSKLEGRVALLKESRSDLATLYFDLIIGLFLSNYPQYKEYSTHEKFAITAFWFANKIMGEVCFVSPDPNILYFLSIANYKEVPDKIYDTKRKTILRTTLSSNIYLNLFLFKNGKV